MSNEQYDNMIAGDFPLEAVSGTVLLGETVADKSLLGKELLAVGDVVIGTNTGNGVLSGFALAAGGPAKIGNYEVTCIAAATNSGTFKIVDPDGITIGTMVVGETPIVGGITFTIADGAADFVIGDTFTLPVEAGSGKLLLSLAAAVDGSQVPYAIATEAVNAAATDVTTSVWITGSFAEENITFGTGHTADSVRDQLRALGIILRSNLAE